MKETPWIIPYLETYMEGIVFPSINLNSFSTTPIYPIEFIVDVEERSFAKEIPTLTYTYKAFVHENEEVSFSGEFLKPVPVKNKTFYKFKVRCLTEPYTAEFHFLNNEKRGE